MIHHDLHHHRSSILLMIPRAECPEVGLRRGSLSEDRLQLFKTMRGALEPKISGKHSSSSSSSRYLITKAMLTPPPATPHTPTPPRSSFPRLTPGCCRFHRRLLAWTSDRAWCPVQGLHLCRVCLSRHRGPNSKKSAPFVSVERRSLIRIRQVTRQPSSTP